MIAPRKKLWSTPKEVIDKAIECLDLSSDDVVYDLGAGDGRFIVSAARKTDAKCIGVEIDEERVNEIKQCILDTFSEEPMRCQIVHGNALDVDLSNASAFFLYLVPRGLRIVLPIIQKIQRRNIRVVTYMSPLPGIEPVAVHKISPQSQPDAEWPLFVYNISNNIDSD